MKIILLALTLTACAFADIIAFKGTVTQAPDPGPAAIGEAFSAWLNFDVLSETTGEPWTPGAIDLSCSFSGECDGAPDGYIATLGAVRVAYSGGAHWGFNTWALDGGFIKLNADLTVADAGVGSGLVYFYGSAAGNGLFSDNYADPDLPPVEGIVTSAQYYAEIPEPSSFLLTTPALAGLFLLAAYRVRMRANQSRLGSS